MEIIGSIFFQSCSVDRNMVEKVTICHDTSCRFGRLIFLRLTRRLSRINCLTTRTCSLVPLYCLGQQVQPHRQGNCKQQHRNKLGICPRFIIPKETNTTLQQSKNRTMRPSILSLFHLYFPLAFTASLFFYYTTDKRGIPFIILFFRNFCDFLSRLFCVIM